MVDKAPAQTPHALIIPRAIYNDIIAHTQEGKPEEVCGLLRGRNGIATELLRARNITANPTIDYEVAPEMLLKVFDWEEKGDGLVGIYHSHPAGPAYPSATDAYKALYSDTAILICSLQDHDNPALSGFLLKSIQGEIDLKLALTELIFVETRSGRWSVHLPGHQPSPASLSNLERPQGTALYVVYQHRREGDIDVRTITIEAVDLLISG